MSKKQSLQALAKIEQGFRKKPDCCGNCQHFQKEEVAKTYTDWKGDRQEWTEDKNMRCIRGSFAVGKSNVCNEHSLVTQ